MSAIGLSSLVAPTLDHFPVTLGSILRIQLFQAPTMPSSNPLEILPGTGIATAGVPTNLLSFGHPSNPQVASFGNEFEHFECSDPPKTTFPATSFWHVLC